MDYFPIFTYDSIPMRRFYVLVISLLLVPFLVSGQNPRATKTDVQVIGLKGKIRQVTCETYVGVKKGNEIVKGEKTGAGYNNFMRTYNNKGWELDCIGYKPDGAIEQVSRRKYSDDGKLFENYDSSQWGPNKIKILYTLNDAGKIIEGFAVDRNDAELSTEKYQYNDAGKITEVASYYDDMLKEKSIYTYNSTSQCVEEKDLNADGSVRGRRTMKYNSDGKQTDWCSYDRDGKVYRIETTTYNEKGFIKDNTDISGNLYFKYVYTAYSPSGYPMEGKNLNKGGTVKKVLKAKFDDKENEIETAWYNVDGSLNSLTTYEYDSTGNWTKKVEYYDKNYTITLRKFEYFK